MHFLELARELVFSEKAVVIARKLAVLYWAGNPLGILAMHHGGVSFEVPSAFSDEGAAV